MGFRGNKEKTPGGLKKTDLMKSKTGKVVGKKAHANGKKAYAHSKGWTTAVQKARKALGVKGFQAVKKGSPLYKKGALRPVKAGHRFVGTPAARCLGRSGVW